MASTLYEYYTGLGQSLPSLSSRSTIYEKAGLGSASSYEGTAAQNTSLLSYLQKAPTTSTTTTVKAPTTITSSSLTPTPAIPYQTPKQVQPYPTTTLPTYSTPTLTATPQEKQATELSKRLQDLNTSLIGESAYRTGQEQSAGVPALNQTVQDLSTQLEGLKNEAAAIPLQLQQGAAERGVTTPVLGRQENSRLRTNAIAALGVSTLLEAARGNLSTAMMTVDRAVAQRYDPIRERIAASTANLRILLDDPETSLQDKNRAQKQLDYENNKLLEIEQAEQSTKNVWSIATSAASSIANFIPSTQYPTAAVALSAISNADSPEEALQIAASSGLASDINSSTTPGTPIGKGTPTGFTQADVKSGDQVLRTGIDAGGNRVGNAMGEDGYIDPAVYAMLLQYWIGSGGTKDSFFTYYPVDRYINPENTWIWSELGIENPFVKDTRSL